MLRQKSQKQLEWSGSTVMRVDEAARCAGRGLPREQHRQGPEGRGLSIPEGRAGSCKRPDGAGTGEKDVARARYPVTQATVRTLGVSWGCSRGLRTAICSNRGAGDERDQRWEKSLRAPGGKQERTLLHFSHGPGRKGLHKKEITICARSPYVRGR